MATGTIKSVLSAPFIPKDSDTNVSTFSAGYDSSQNQYFIMLRFSNRTASRIGWNDTNILCEQYDGTSWTRKWIK